MIKTALNCPNCGAKYNPAKMRCEFCGSFVVFPKEKMFTIPDDIVAEMKAAVQQPDTNASKEQLGIYIFGSLLEKATVFHDDRMVFQFKNGMEIEVGL